MYTVFIFIILVSFFKNSLFNYKYCWDQHKESIIPLIGEPKD